MNQPELEQLGEGTASSSQWIARITAEMGRVVIGQACLVKRLLTGLLSDGHVLLEGVPGSSEREGQFVDKTRKEI